MNAARTPLGVAILGSTGTIGDNTLDVIARHPDRLAAVALGARSNVVKLLAQIERFRPAYAALADATANAELARAVRDRGLATRVVDGPQPLEQLGVLAEVDAVMAAIVGAAGLRSTLAAARAGKRVLLANKESLVMAGSLMMDAVRDNGATLLPIDSEHNAIFQCLPHGARTGEAPAGVRRILLTASGGPFVDLPAGEFESVTPAQACAHPNWVMGRKISVDSATLMNKGLEFIEAGLLFGVPHRQIEIVVHRESIVHSMVEYVDGSVLAQLGSPDMRTPIAHALAWPDRVASGVQFLDLLRVGKLRFEPPDLQRFPALALAQAAASQGGLMPAVLNAANEVAVAAFLEDGLNFARIPAVIEAAMSKMPRGEAASLEDVLAADAEARVHATEAIGAARVGAVGAGSSSRHASGAELAGHRRG
jgi:1-deoxy-D-xylulose-5-phosphate reductoisomerase